MIDKRDLENFARQVDQILWAEWDPIGCGVPRDEYTSYAIVVAAKAANGESAEQITDYLHWAENDNMGLACTREQAQNRVANIVAKIRSLAAILPNATP